ARRTRRCCGGLYLGNAWAVRQNPLRPGCLLRVAGRGAGFDRVGGRIAFRPGHRRGQEPAGFGKGPGVPGPSGARGDRLLLPALLLYGQGEYGRDGGYPALQLASFRGGACAAVPEGGAERGEGARALPDHRWDPPGRRRLRPGKSGGEPEGVADRIALGPDLRAVFDLRPSRGRPPGSFHHPELRTLLRGLSARRDRASHARYADRPSGWLLRPAADARGGAHDARVRALHLRARTPRGGEGGHSGHRRARCGRRPRGGAAWGGPYRTKSGRRRTRDHRRGAGPGQASQAFQL
ncbi:MAG: hypothetical protein AVDCRST_MAG58-443, partial [uncultured Rubrobacteraceae bacterium]